jgi:nucleoside-diphosphate-sugar epimerase
MPTDVAVCGGSGFIGRHLLRTLASDAEASVRVLVHRNDPGVQRDAGKFIDIPGDLLDAGSLNALVTPGCTVVNLAYLSTRSREENLAAAASLSRACRAREARRLVHLSTAVVAGAATGDVITESTLPDPRTGYERTKLEIEEFLGAEARGAFELVVLRPTGVFGPGGTNLVKLAGNLLGASAIANYARSCFHGRRRMNLVCVENVVAAVRFAFDAPAATGPETFIVSDDDDALNDYRGVESTLRQAFGLSEYPVPPMPLPGSLFGLALRARGRSNNNPNRVYSSAKLAAAGCPKQTSLESGLVSFADWYRRSRG